LLNDELLHYRDRLRAARYAALADAEGFEEICFVVEAFGIRIYGRQVAMYDYQPLIKEYAVKSPLFDELVTSCPSFFTKFDALYETLRLARNDAMHTGTYARHATEAAIELCIGLEDALMILGTRETVQDFMVKSPMEVESWQPLARARQLMLMHSFSFLPVKIGSEWKLVSELSLALYLNTSGKTRKLRLAQSIDQAIGDKLELVDILDDNLLVPEQDIQSVFSSAKVQAGPMLWLVVNSRTTKRLVGVLSPFELM